MNRNLKLFATICLACFMVSCAMLQVSETQIETYAKALGAWTDAVTQFKFYYEKADVETKAKWDAEFRPTLIKAKELLNMWKMHLDTGNLTSGDVEQWKSMKNEIIYYLATMM